MSGLQAHRARNMPCDFQCECQIVWYHFSGLKPANACKSAGAPESVPWQSCELHDRFQVHLRSSTCLWSQLHWDLKSGMQPEQCWGTKNTGCHSLYTNGFHCLLVSRASWRLARCYSEGLHDPVCSADLKNWLGKNTGFLQKKNYGINLCCKLKATCDRSFLDVWIRWINKSKITSR